MSPAPLETLSETPPPPPKNKIRPMVVCDARIRELEDLMEIPHGEPIRNIIAANELVNRLEAMFSTGTEQPPQREHTARPPVAPVAAPVTSVPAKHISLASVKPGVGLATKATSRTGDKMIDAALAAAGCSSPEALRNAKERARLTSLLPTLSGISRASVQGKIDKLK